MTKYRSMFNRKITFLLVLITSVFAVRYFEPSVANVNEVPVGTQAPNFHLIDIRTNESFSLTDYLGKVVILDLFATWCGPCRAAIPGILELTYIFEPSDLVIISIDVDSRETKSQVIEFAENLGMTWIVALDNNSFVSENYGTGYIPTMYIINQTGYVHYSEIGFDQSEVINSLKNLISPESTAPMITGEPSITITGSMLDFYNREIIVTCQNVTDNSKLRFVYIEVKSSSTLLQSKQYILAQLDDGSINTVVQIDPRQLYHVSSIDVSFIAEDLAGNTQIGKNTTFQCQLSDVDDDKPTISSITLNYTINNNYYDFLVTMIITDDVFVYEVTLKLREGEKPQIYTVTNIWQSASNHSIFYASYSLHTDKVTNPDDVFVEMEAVDLVGNSVTGSSKTEFLTSNKSTPFEIFHLLPFLFLAFITINKARRGNKHE